MEKFTKFYNNVTYFLSELWITIHDKLSIIITFLFGIYLVPTYEMILVISFFMISNLLSGIWKTVKLNGLKSVSPKRIFDSLIKLVLYVFGLIVIYVLQHHIGKDLVDLIWVYASVVSIREVKSIIGNIETITDTKIWFAIKSHITDMMAKMLKTDKLKKTE